jgi:transposase-like protein
MTTAYETACLNHDHEIEVGMQYTPDFKREAVRLAKGSQGAVATATALGITERTIRFWMQAYPESPLVTASTKTPSADQTEIARLRGELTMDKMERDVLESTIGFFDKARR